MSAEKFLNEQILELREQRAGLMKMLDERNEATKVWIQSDTQTRQYANRLEKALEEIDQTLRVSAAEYVPAIGDVFTIIDRTKRTHAPRAKAE